MKKIFSWSIVILLGTSSCRVTRQSVSKSISKNDSLITITFVQVNDVYEIAPLANGAKGGMARVATIKKECLQKNPNTFLVIAGDFLSPSVYNSLKYKGKAIRGKQMVDAMNAAGMDFAIFGNHELDIKEGELQERLNESNFQWIASNTFHKIKDSIIPFTKTKNGITTNIPTYFIKTVKDADGTTAKIGFIGLTIPFNKEPYVYYTDPLTAAKEVYNKIKDSVDAVVAITHELIKDDEILAKEIPGLAMIIGGHEHSGRFEKIGNVYITKALANAESAYVLNLTINKKNHTTSLEPKLIMVNDSTALDSATNVVVQKWQKIASTSYDSIGFDAKDVIIKSGEPLDAREIELRQHPTNYTKLIIKSIQQAAPKADVVIVNAGSIRVDDYLQPPVTEYDIIRSLPFGDGISEVDMNGALLMQVLDAGKHNRGIGGYLLYNENLHFDDNLNAWILNNNAINPQKIYRVAMSNFLLTGGEANLNFLNRNNPGIVKIYEEDASANNPLLDIRTVIIDYLKGMEK